MIDTYLALDVGQARIGAAIANSVAQIAAPLPVVAHTDTVFEDLRTLAAEHAVTALVVGWPRGLDGQATAQTAYVEAFAEKLGQALELPVHMQDEAVTSVAAKAELRNSGKDFEKGDIDSLSAVYILEDFLTEAVH